KNAMLISFFSFTIFALIGFFAAKHDREFLFETLSYDYVTMTEKNIIEGKPFEVYAEGDSILMWLGIFFNNIRVSFYVFAIGIFGAVFAIFHLMYEGLRVGAFEYMFYSHGLGIDAVLTIMIHGTLELSAIVIAGGAGIGIGASFLFPGTHTRLHAFKNASKDGVKIIVGLLPVFFMAAFFEGFITRYYNMPLLLNLFILILSALYIIYYFVLYPISVFQLSKK